MSAAGTPAGDSEPIDSGRSSVLVGAGIGLSRLSGLIRESAVGAYLATGASADAFRAALRIPNLLQNLLGEGVLSAAFIPVYARLVGEGDDAEAGKVAGAIAGLLAALTGVLVVIGVVLARPLTAVLAPGFEGEKYELTVTLVRIMTAGIGFLVLSAWCLGVLNTHRRFFLSYVAPVIWNATQIAVITFVGVRGWTTASAAEALAWAVFAGGVLQFLVQLPTVRRVAGRIRPTLDVRRPGVRASIHRFGPAVLGRGVVQLGAYVDLMLASLLATGAVAALGYAQVLYLLPISLFAMSVAAAELPELSRRGAATHGLSDRLATGLDRIGFFVVFSAIAYVVAGDQIVAAIFERGRFDGADTTLVATLIGAYALGLPAIGASRLLQNTLFSQGDVRGPARIAAARVVLAGALGVVLMFQLDQVTVTDGSLAGFDQLPVSVEPLPEAVRTRDGAPLRLGAAGLALASAAAAWLELALLRRRVHRRIGLVPPVGAALVALVPAGIAAVAGMVVVELAAGDLPALVAAPVVVGLGGLVYVGVARATGSATAAALVDSARKVLPGRSGAEPTDEQ